MHQVEIELESIRVQLEEESEARLDLERQLTRANGEVQTWRSKYETEAAARAEEVEEIRYVSNILKVLNPVSRNCHRQAIPQL